MNDRAIVYYNANIMCCFPAFSAVADPELQKRWRSNHPDPEKSGGGGGGDVRGGGGVGLKNFFVPAGLILI